MLVVLAMLLKIFGLRLHFKLSLIYLHKSQCCYPFSCTCRLGLLSTEADYFD